jgi:hypothetical protein
MRIRRFQRLAWMGAGASLGLAIGIALAVGIWIGLRSTGSGAMAGLPLEELRLKASAAHGSDTFAIATGPVDGNVDGVFCLDFLTGDLTGYVLHPRNGKFFAAFRTNVLDKLPVEQGKAPKYALAVGRFSTVSSYTNVKPGASVVYVADCNTGRLAAYGFPWDKSVSVNQPTSLIAVPMLPLDYAEARKLKLRE